MARRSPPRLIVTYVLLGLWSAICIFPVYWLAITSIRPVDDIDSGPHYLPFLDFAPSLRAWNFILFDSNENLQFALLNSAIVALAGAALALTFGAMASYGLTRFSFGLSRSGGTAANRPVMWGLLATRVLPPVAVVLPLYMMAQWTRTLDTRFALIITYTAINLPVAAWLLQPVLGTRATEQEEAAKLDGASHMLIFFTIVVPMAASGIAAAGFLVLVLCWNEYLFAAYLTTDHAMTLPVWLVGQMSIKEAQIGSEAEELANFSAVAMLMILPLVIFASFAQRVLTRRSTWKM